MENEVKEDWRDQLHRGVAPEDLDTTERERPVRTRERKRYTKPRVDEGIRRHQPGTLPPTEES